MTRNGPGTQSSPAPRGADCGRAAGISGEGVHTFDNATALGAGQPSSLCDFNGSDAIAHGVWFAPTAMEASAPRPTLCGQSPALAVDTKEAAFDTAGGAQQACNAPFSGGGFRAVAAGDQPSGKLAWPVARARG